eukprot:scpid62681/ scgid7606/ 
MSLVLLGTKPAAQRLEKLCSRKELEAYLRTAVAASCVDVILRTVRNNQHLDKLMRTPFLVVVMIELYETGVTRANTFSEMFLVLEGFLLAQLHSRQNRGSQLLDVFFNLPVLRVSAELGRFALIMIFQNRDAFSKQDMNEHRVSEAARTLGFIIPYTDTGDFKHEQWTFIHPSVQGALAANYVTSGHGIGYQTWLITSIVPVFEYHQQACAAPFWIQFCARACQSCAVQVLKLFSSDDQAAICSSLRQMIIKWNTHIVDYSLFPESDIMYWATHLSGFLSDLEAVRLKSILLFDSSLARLENLKAEHRQAIGMGRAQYLEQVLLQWRHIQPKANCHRLYEALKEAQADPFICDIWLASIHVITTPLVPSLVASTNYPCLLLAFRCFHEFAVSPAYASAADSTSDVMHTYLVLMRYRGLWGLGLRACDYRAMGTVLRHCSDDVTSLSLHFASSLDDKSYSCLAPGLSQLSRLENLTLIGCVVTDRQASHIAAVIRANESTLKTVWLDNSQMSAAGRERVQEAVSRCSDTATDLSSPVCPPICSYYPSGNYGNNIELEGSRWYSQSQEAWIVSIPN